MNEKEIKIKLRQEMLARRDGLSLSEKTVLDKELCLNIKEIILKRNARVIHTYLPFGSEIDIFPLIQFLLENDYKVICPKALPKRNLENLVLNSLNELEQGRFGTFHPANSVAYDGDIDLFIVPGLAFDRLNYRLGYGPGYYDKFFATHPNGYKLGVCYPFQIEQNFLTEPHDIRLDSIMA